MLDEHALELERTQSVIRRFEHVIRAAHKGKVAVVVSRCDVAGVIIAVSHRVRRLRVIIRISVGEADRPIGEAQTDFTFIRRHVPFGIEQYDVIAGKRPAHRSGLHRLTRRVADLGGRLSLAVTVSDRQPPCFLHLSNHFRIERLAGRQDFTQRHAIIAQRLLDQHAPDSRRRAEGCNPVRYQCVEHQLRVEARVIGDEDGCLRVPRREERAPCVLRPPWRADVPMPVAGLQPDPVQRREVTHRIALVRVHHKLWLCSRSRREVQEHRVAGARCLIRSECRIAVSC